MNIIVPVPHHEEVVDSGKDAFVVVKSQHDIYLNVRKPNLISNEPFLSFFCIAKISGKKEQERKKKKKDKPFFFF